MTTVFNHPEDIVTALDPDGRGAALGASDWMEMTQYRINQFADATDDHQWIHVNTEKAKTGPFGATIAHGYLTLALVNRFLPEIMDVRNFSSGVNYGCNKVRFPAPLKVGSRIRGVGELVAAEEVKGGAQATVYMVVEVEGSDRPVCVAEVISRYFY